MLNRITKWKTSCIVFLFCFVNLFIILQDNNESAEEFSASDYSYDIPHDLAKNDEQIQNMERIEKTVEITSNDYKTATSPGDTTKFRIKNTIDIEYEKWVQNHKDLLVEKKNQSTIRQIMEERKVSFEKRKHHFSPLPPFHYKISAGYSMDEFLTKYNLTCEARNVTAIQMFNKSLCPCLPKGLGKYVKSLTPSPQKKRIHCMEILFLINSTLYYCCILHKYNLVHYTLKRNWLTGL